MRGRYREPDGAWGETLDEFRFAARCIRDLFEAWRLIRRDIEPPDLRLQLPYFDVSSEDATRLLTRGLNAGLVNLHPRLEPHTVEGTKTAGLWPTPCLYEICCLELYTHIVSNAVHRHCANERCQKLFVRKELGARHRRARTKGLKFCSDRCADAQHQRESRARRALASSTNRPNRRGKDHSS